MTGDFSLTFIKCIQEGWVFWKWDLKYMWSWESCESVGLGQCVTVCLVSQYKTMWTTQDFCEVGGGWGVWGGGGVLSKSVRSFLGTTKNRRDTRRWDLPRLGPVIKSSQNQPISWQHSKHYLQSANQFTAFKTVILQSANQSIAFNTVKKLLANQNWHWQIIHN